MLRRIGSLVRKELLQLRRNPVLLILIGYLFTICVLLCGSALTFDLNDAALAVENLDPAPASRALVERLDRSPDFRVAAHAWGDANFASMLDRGEAVAVVRIPPGWSRSLYGRESSSLQVIVDGANAGTAAAVRGYLSALIRRHAFEGAGLEGGGQPAGPIVENRSRVWFNSDLKTVYFMVISMLASAAMMVGVILPAASLVGEREHGTLEQLLVSPVLPRDLVVAKSLVTLLVTLVALTVGLGGVWWFDVPMRGSVGLFYLVSAAFMLGSIGIGVVIASFSKNLQQALFLSVFGLLPVMFLSGTMVPVENMPRLAQLATLASPLRYYMDCLLGIFLKGAGWEVLWPQIAAMTALGLAILGCGLLRLRSALG